MATADSPHNGAVVVSPSLAVAVPSPRGRYAEDDEGSQDGEEISPRESEAESLDQALIQDKADHYKSLLTKQEVVLREIQRKTADYSEVETHEVVQGNAWCESSATSAVEGMLVQRELRRARVGERRRSCDEDMLEKVTKQNSDQQDQRMRRQRQKKEQKEEMARRFFAVHSRAKEFQKARREIEQERKRYAEAWYARLAAGERHDRRALTPGQTPSAQKSLGMLRSIPGDMSLSASLPCLTTSGEGARGGTSPRLPAEAPLPSAPDEDVCESVLKSRAFYASTMERWEGVVAQNDKRCAAYWQKISGDGKARKARSAPLGGSKRPHNGSKSPSTDVDNSTPAGSLRQPSRRGCAGARLRGRLSPELALEAAQDEASADLHAPAGQHRASDETLVSSSPAQGRGAMASKTATGSRPSSESSRWETRQQQCARHWEERQEHALLKWRSKSEAIVQARRRVDDETRRRAAKAAACNRRWQERSGSCRQAVAESSDALMGLGAEGSMMSMSMSGSALGRCATADSQRMPQKGGGLPGMRWAKPQPDPHAMRVREVSMRLQEEHRERIIEKNDKNMARAAETQAAMAENFKTNMNTRARFAEQQAVAKQRIAESDQAVREKALESLQVKNERIQGWHNKQTMNFLERHRLLRSSRGAKGNEISLAMLKDIPVPAGHCWEVEGSWADEAAFLSEPASNGSWRRASGVRVSLGPEGPDGEPRVRVSEGRIDARLDSQDAVLKEIERRSTKWLKELQRPPGTPQAKGLAPAA